MAVVWPSTPTTFILQQNTDLNPSLCGIFCSDQIPSKANDFSGQNVQRVDIPELDTQLKTVDSTFDEPTRIAASKDGDRIMAENQITLPMNPFPNVALWRHVTASAVCQRRIRDCPASRDTFNS